MRSQNTQNDADSDDFADSDNFDDKGRAQNDTDSDDFADSDNFDDNKGDDKKTSHAAGLPHKQIVRLVLTFL